MYLRFSKVTAKGHTYEYAQVCQTVRVGKRTKRKVLFNLGRRDLLRAQDIDALIAVLGRLASPETEARRPLSELELIDARDYGGALACWQLWQLAGLEESLSGQSSAFREAVFRLVSSRLLEPQSKLQTSEWQDAVQWPSSGPRPSYDRFLEAMDRLLPLKPELERRLFERYTQDLFNLSLRFVLYDLSSSYFEGDGVCELAEFGHSRDHRPDRRQVSFGLAITPEGLPITQRIFPGNTGDSKTLLGSVSELRQRFGLTQVVIVGDQGMFSAENVKELEAERQPYLLAIRVRSMKLGTAAVAAAEKQGLERPKDPQAEWSYREVSVENGRRHVVVFSAFKAAHDRVVRQARLKKTRAELRGLARHAARQKLKRKEVIAAASRIFTEHETGQYFGYLAGDGSLSFWLERSVYRRQRRLDGIFILQTNQNPALLSTSEAVAAYRQLMEVERSFRLLKSPVIRLRPIYHWTKRRVEAHLFVCYLAFLLAKLLELKLAELPESERWQLSGEEGRRVTAARALSLLQSLKAGEHQWQDWHMIKVSRPRPEVVTILRQLGLAQIERLISLRQLTA